MARTVLIVDDSESCLASLEMTLMPFADLDVRMAASGREALDLITSRLPELALLITDLDLPRMDGFELIERVRRKPELKDLPIIVISGDCDPRTPARLERLGVNKHITKPYSPAEVRQILEQFLNVRK